MTKNAICHVEFASTDLERTKAFLWGLFGWEFQPFGANYLLFSKSGPVGGGIWRVPEVTPGNSPTVYVEVEAIEPCLEQAPELGGAVVAEKREIPDFGWYAHIADPDGNVIGLFVKK
jgi:predicted enzyme related to lactoylglutathione lyase